MADGRLNNKGNERNFIPFNQMSKEEATALRSAGGKAAAKVRRAKKDFQDLAKEILEGKVDYPLNEIPGFEAYDKKFIKSDGTVRQITVAQRILLAMTKKAIHGDVAAATFIRDSSGYAPIKKLQADVRTAGFEIDWGNVFDRMEEEKELNNMEGGLIIDGE